MDAVQLSLALAFVYAVGLGVSGRAFGREVERAARAKQPPPRILSWWERVARAWRWLVPLSLALIVAGFALGWLYVGLGGVVLLGYAGQAFWMRRAARRALSAAAR